MIKRIFPNEKSQERIFVDNRLAFRAYRGRCKLAVANRGIYSAIILINGKEVAVVREGVVRDVAGNYGDEILVDAGWVARDGYNLLKVLDIEAPLPDVFLEICIDFPCVTHGKPEQAGFDTEKLNRVDAFINAEIEAGFPGAALCVIKNGIVVKNQAWGHARKYDAGNLLAKDKWQTLTTDTLFDMASNTKIYATVYALMHFLWSEKIRSVDDLVCNYLPEFSGDGRERITLRDLLTHQAGFAPEYRTYNPACVPEGCYSQSRQKTIQLLNQVKPLYARGAETRYSDTDFMLLGLVVEAIAGRTQDEYVEECLFRPLGLKRTLFNPLKKGCLPGDCAATERMGNTRDGNVTFPNVRRYTLQGEVHDEKAWYAMEGIAGHAGLFSTALETAVLAQCVLNGGGYGNKRLFDERTIEIFSCGNEKALRFGLGWNKMGADTTWEFGPYAGAYTIGHTGWTGTVTAIDREHDMAIVLLTNCIHSPYVKENEQFLHKQSPFETGRFGSVMALIYEAFMEA